MEIHPFFTVQELEQLARDVGFVQREGKINGALFLDLIVFNNENLKKQSLNDLCVELKDKHDIEIKKQSLHDRFNDNALDFLKAALEKLLQKQIQVDLSLGEIEGMNRILIKDSVCFQIDESLSEYYPGSGGSGSKASVRIQFEYDLLSGKINDLSINAFNNQDATNSVATIELTEPGDLIIRDLAYMGLTVLQLLIDKLAFFLCRLGTNVNVYEMIGEQYVKIDFKKICEYMKKHNLEMMEKEVYIGFKERIQVRLIIHLLPAEEVSKRLRKARANNKKKKRGKLSKEFVARAHLNLFITNAGKEQISTEKVWKLYRLRWQIELVFKIWKSICDIEKVKKVKKSRLECYIYSKLIFIVLGWKVLWGIAKEMFVREGKVLSFYKAYKTLLHKKVKEVRDVFMLGIGTIGEFMKKLYEISVTNHILEKKRQKPTYMELLLSCLND